MKSKNTSDLNTFKNVLRLKFQYIKSYESFEQVFLKISNEHTPLKTKTSSSKSWTLYEHTKPFCGGVSLKVSALIIGLFKIKLNMRNKRIFAANFIRTNRKSSTQT